MTVGRRYTYVHANAYKTVIGEGGGKGRIWGSANHPGENTESMDLR